MGKLINTALVFIGGMTAGGYCVVNAALKSETFTTALKDAIGKKAVEVVYGATDEQPKHKMSYSDAIRNQRSMNRTLDRKGKSQMAKPYINILEEKGIGLFLSTDKIDELRNFDPKTQYAMTECDKPILRSHVRQLEVGKNINLIKDMCWYGAMPEELVRAIKHGIVLINAEEHLLDWVRSAEENGVEELNKKYRRFWRNAELSQHEKLVISAYTGFALIGDPDKITTFIEETIGHAIKTSEQPEIPVIVEIHRAFKEEFCEICRKHHIFGI